MSDKILIQEELTRSILGAFFEVHRHLGFGFLEHVYSSALERELVARGHSVVREFKVNVYYKGEIVAYHRLDMVVDDIVILENKAGVHFPPMAREQLYSYLKSTKFEVGLVLHFGPKARFKREIHTNK